MAQVLENFPRKHKKLSSNPRNTKRINEKKKEMQKECFGKSMGGLSAFTKVDAIFLNSHLGFLPYTFYTV
jgi:hypothetical protein